MQASLNSSFHQHLQAKTKPVGPPKHSFPCIVQEPKPRKFGYIELMLVSLGLVGIAYLNTAYNARVRENALTVVCRMSDFKTPT